MTSQSHCNLFSQKVRQVINGAVVKLKKIRNCAIFDKSTKLSGVLAHGMKFIFRRGGIEFSNLGGPCGFFYGHPKIGHNCQTLKL